MQSSESDGWRLMGKHGHSIMILIVLLVTLIPNANAYSHTNTNTDTNPNDNTNPGTNTDDKDVERRVDLSFSLIENVKCFKPLMTSIKGERERERERDGNMRDHVSRLSCF